MNILNTNTLVDTKITKKGCMHYVNKYHIQLYGFCIKILFIIYNHKNIIKNYKIIYYTLKSHLKVLSKNYQYNLTTFTKPILF